MATASTDARTGPTKGQTPAPSTSAERRQPDGVDPRDPLATAAAFIERRLTYRYDDPAGYAAAVTAPAYTTPALAARSRPTSDERRRLQAAQEVSAVRVHAAEVAVEAPNTAAARFVSVAFTATVSYRGAETGRPSKQVWTLRMSQTRDQGWRVDAVLSTD